MLSVRYVLREVLVWCGVVCVEEGVGVVWCVLSEVLVWCGVC